MKAASPIDYRELARRRVPHFLFEYLDGGSFAETTVLRNVADLQSIELRQRVMRDVSSIDVSTNLFGNRQSLSLTGNYLDAETAERWGLVNRVYAPDELLPAAKKLAAEMAGVEGGLLKRMKAVIDDGLALPLPEALKMEIERGSKNNSAVTPAVAEESRKTAMARGREQAG